MLLRKLLLALSLSAGIAMAEGSDPEGMENLSLADLMNIKLQTGSFLELDLSKSPLSMTLIKRDQIAVSGARNLSELLETYVPGFQYTINKWNGIQWGMRGVSNDRNTKFIVLVNGHKINTESKDGFITETQLGLLGDMERVEVLRGPAGLVYGSGAIAGIVNIVTRRVERNTTEVEVGLANQANMQVTGKQVDIRSFSYPASGHELVATLGWRQSDGVGESVSRLYGSPAWPNDRMTTWEKKHGFPSNGSYGSTPGDYRASVDWTWDRLRVYGRYTHQIVSNGAFFGKALWPGFMGPTNESWMGGSPTQWRPNLSKLIDSLNTTGLANAASAADSSAVRTQVATLRSIYDQLPNLGCAKVDGRDICPTDTFWSWSNGHWNWARRQWVADAFTLSADYEIPVGENSLKLNAAWDGATNRNQLEPKVGYEAWTPTETGTTKADNTFGERRYTFGAMYLMKTLPRTQLAVGIQERIDVFGEDLEGYNHASGKPLHKTLSDVTYSNTALFTEGFTDVTERVGMAYGVRWDGHTRTVDDGGTLNGKLALVLSPVSGHTVKLIAQSSTNNGTVDNYEHNGGQFDDKGVEHNGAYLSDPTDTTTLVTSGQVTLDELHKLKPERIYSFEAVTTHDLDLGPARLYLSPSVSYNVVQDLFAWAQPLGRVVNSGEYHHLDVDFEGRLDWKAVTFGFNHAVQMPINTRPDELYDTVVGPSHYTFQATGKDASGKTTYAPVADKFENRTAINPVKDQVTRDGESFYGMATHVSKFWLDVRPFSWMTLHTDARVFWGLEGRDSVYKAMQQKDYNFLAVNNTPIVKLNAGLQVSLPSSVKVSFHVHNILGEDKGDGNSSLTIHTVRWGQGMDDGLYAVDLRSYAMKVEKAF